MRTTRPSPLGRVAEQSEVGRGAVKCCVYIRIPANTYCLHTSSVMQTGSEEPVCMPPSPKGKAWVRLTFKQQYIVQYKGNTN